MNTLSETKIKIAYNPEQDTWNVGSLRILLKELNTDEFVDLLIITTSTDTKLIEDIQDKIGIEDSNVFITADIASLIVKLKDENCNIFLSKDAIVGREVEESNPLILSTDNVTGSKFIEFNNILDHSKIQPKVLSSLAFWVDQIRRYINGKEDN